MVLTKAGKAKHTAIEANDVFKLGLEYQFDVSGPTKFNSKV